MAIKHPNPQVDIELKWWDGKESLAEIANGDKDHLGLRVKIPNQNVFGTLIPTQLCKKVISPVPWHLQARTAGINAYGFTYITLIDDKQWSSSWAKQHEPFGLFSQIGNYFTFARRDQDPLWHLELITGEEDPDESELTLSTFRVIKRKVSHHHELLRKTST